MDRDDELSASARRIAGWFVVVSCSYAACLAVAVSRTRPPPLATIGLVATVAPMGALGAIDLVTRRLPRRIAYAGALLSLPLLTVAPSGESERHASSALGAVVMVAITGVIYVLGRGSLGRGDLHLSVLLGTVAGWFHPLLAVTSWIATAIIGTAASVVVMAASRRRSTRFAYGPVMIAGLCIALIAHRPP